MIKYETMYLAARADPAQPGLIIATLRLLGSGRVLMRYGDFDL
jgi:hypothetical protein